MTWSGSSLRSRALLLMRCVCQHSRELSTPFRLNPFASVKSVDINPLCSAPSTLPKQTHPLVPHPQPHKEGIPYRTACESLQHLCTTSTTLTRETGTGPLPSLSTHARTEVHPLTGKPPLPSQTRRVHNSE
jgi:hypothetical protein